MMSSDAPGAGVAFATGSDAALFVSILTTAGSTRFASAANDGVPGWANDETAVNAKTTSKSFIEVTRGRIENIKSFPF